MREVLIVRGVDIRRRALGSRYACRIPLPLKGQISLVVYLPFKERR